MIQILMTVLIMLFTTLYVSGQSISDLNNSKENKDLTKEVENISKQYVTGTHLLTTFKSGYKVNIFLQKDSLYKYIVTSPTGEIVPVTPITTSGLETNCWDCFIDEEGIRNCFKIPCPIIKKPGKSGRKPTTAN